ncbi:MCE family protein [Aeromicrobium duanguangcaii]|uniref:MCE family protein n=1 Tax=Aeromicrobium duanguangcaii TaxID=2968086 RepID=A0ABY5KCX8_9ACTN|nr:MCE family protein [Aeromicrobium duanguangcaii]MCD9155418.1 MCE family protein [Aeromicrobium duanguangcaii]MCL3838395.1 MCE family protein [Aeromicrobium duanguangcaii]UUI68311.1 MCE family protein [Aeromicrobium duanguangcaii]
MSRTGFDRRTTIAFTKLMAFLVITGLMTALLAAVIGNASFDRTNEYKAVFTDVTSLVEGDDVRIAGVRVGNVADVRVRSGSTAEVTFRVDSDITLTQSTEATLRYRNMIGQRYLALAEGTDGPAGRLKPGETVDLDRTTPALDLTDLFGGFQPLFEALSPEDTNQLAYELIQVFQGESGTVESLLSHTASLTGTLAERDELIGSVIDNLTVVLTSFNERDDELSTAISTLQQLITGLKDDRGVLTGSLDDIATLTGETAGLLQESRPALTADIRNLRRVTDKVGTKRALRDLDNTLGVLPIKIDRIGRTGEYGSFFSFFVCDVGVNGELPSLSGVPGWEKNRPFKTTKRVTVTGPGVSRCR